MKTYYQIFDKGCEVMIFVSDNDQHSNDDFDVCSQIVDEFNENVDGYELAELTETAYAVYDVDGEPVDDVATIQNLIDTYLPHWTSTSFGV